jgi:hypothetical protein
VLCVIVPFILILIRQEKLDEEWELYQDFKQLNDKKAAEEKKKEKQAKEKEKKDKQKKKKNQKFRTQVKAESDSDFIIL